MSVAEAGTALMKAGSQQSLIKKLAEKYDIEAGKFYNAIVSTVFPAGKPPKGGEATPGRGIAPSEAMVMTFLIVCNQYDLNPFLREIYPFVDGEGNLKIIIGIDGWIKTALRQPDYDGHDFQEHIDTDGNLFAVTCSIFRKDRSRPVKMVEYMKECKMGTTPWEKWPHRMLHHKAFIQASRYAFGMGDLMDEDELDRIRGGSHTNTILEEPRRLSEADKPALPAAQSTASPEPITIPKAQIPTGEIPAENGDAVDEADIKRVWQIAFPKGISKVDVNTMIKKKFGVDRVQALNKTQLDVIIGDIQAL